MNPTNTSFEGEYNQYLSFVDLEQHPEWNDAWKNQDKERVEAILYSLGADISNGWSIEVNLHRTRTTNKVEYGPRFCYTQRKDKAWQKWLSVEDLIETSNDWSLKLELQGMNKHGYGTVHSVKSIDQNVEK